jgi:hypothetical protein
VALVLGIGLALRVWLLAHLPLTGDESVVGLMARQINSGHFSTFYWGQHYGGVEPYVVAAVFGLAGPGAASLDATATILAAVAALLAGATVREMTGRWKAGLVAGVLVWIWPYAAMWNSVHELGFRQATLCCGLAVLWCAARLRRPQQRVWVAGALGLSLGLGWWASPEILYFALPAAIVAGGHALVARRWKRGEPVVADRRPFITAALVGGVVGAAPWLYTNVRTGFVSLRPSAAGISGGTDFLGRIGVFFRHALPTQLGTQTIITGRWLGGPVVGVLVLAILLVAIACAGVTAVRRLWRDGSGVPLATVALAVVLFPLLFAAVPGSGYWADARYGIFLGPLVVVLLVGAVGGPRSGAPAKHPVAAVLGALALVGATALTLAGAHASGIPVTSASRFTSGWSDPNAATRAAVAAMEARGVRTAYGDYWISYTLDLLSGGRVAVSPSPLDVNRTPQLAAEVAAAPRSAWLFFAPSDQALASWTFSNPEPGPGTLTEPSFEALLRAHGDPFRVLHLGVLDAVVPAHPLPTAALFGSPSPQHP